MYQRAWWLGVLLSALVCGCVAGDQGGEPTMSRRYSADPDEPVQSALDGIR
jgi:hypothetical protein